MTETTTDPLLRGQYDALVRSYFTLNTQINDYYIEPGKRPEDDYISGVRRARDFIGDECDRLSAILFPEG